LFVEKGWPVPRSGSDIASAGLIPGTTLFGRFIEELIGAISREAAAAYSPQRQLGDLDYSSWTSLEEATAIDYLTGLSVAASPHARS